MTRSLDWKRITPIAAVIAIGCTGQVPAGPPLQPQAWVPFQADFRSVGRNTETQGRLFRRGDGSVRREALAADGSPAFVTIENRATGEFHSFSAGSWTTQLLVVGRAAPPAASEFPNAMPQPDRVAGYRVVRADTVLGSRMLRAPVLNYFALVEEHPDPPLRIECLSVTERVPADTLFAPPAGASVARLPWPQFTGT